MYCWADYTWIMLRMWNTGSYTLSLLCSRVSCNPEIHPLSFYLIWTMINTQNGLATFGWWTLLEALDSLGLVPRYQASLPDPLVSSMVLTLLLLGMLIWFFFESFIFSKYICYTFTVYHVLIVGLEAMFTRGYHVQDLAPTQSTV
ncbi:unnamed protein product, partial [Coregonus sp. 'balchen']